MGRFVEFYGRQQVLRRHCVTRRRTSHTPPLSRSTVATVRPVDDRAGGRADRFDLARVGVNANEVAVFARDAEQKAAVVRKGVAFLSRYQEICGQCNGRYLDALAHVDDPTPAIGALDALSSRAATADGRTVRPFNPVARQERTLFEVLMSGEYVLHGFTNRELREHLVRVGFPLAAAAVKQSGQVTRLLRRLHIHHLIAKIPRSRRWRVSRNGRRVMAAAVKLREGAYPSLYAEAA